MKLTVEGEADSGCRGVIEISRGIVNVDDVEQIFSVKEARV